MIRVAIADDHPEVRVALRLLLSLSKEVQVVGEASNGEEAVNCAQRLQPDVLVMDIQMPVLDGFAATKQLIDLSVPTRIILISSHTENFFARQAAAIGARGFIPKEKVAKSLLAAIETVHEGELFFMD